MPIERIRTGDTVLAYDVAAGRNVARTVYDLHRSFTYCWVDILLADGTRLTATRFHPFWLESEQAWVDAWDLQPTMALRMEDGRTLAISEVDVRVLDHPEATYNLEVEGAHTYYAGESPVLVHNGPGPGYYDAADFIVYQLLRDGVPYIGRTRVDWRHRYGTKPVGWIVLNDALSYVEARGVEQHYIDKFGLDHLSNKRNGIDPKRTDAAANKYRKAARELFGPHPDIPGC